MRCYFNLVSEIEVIPDPSGIEVDNIGLAHLEALRTVRQLWDQDTAYDWRGWTLEAVDQDGIVTFTIDLERLPRPCH